MKIKVNGVEITDYLVNDITFNLDAVASSFSLTLPYFEYWPVNQKLFKPLEFQKVEIWDNSGKVKLLTGTIINNTKKATKDGTDLAISGYSLPGVLEDCPHVSDISTTSKNLTLKELTESLIKPFGIKLVVDSIVSSKCDETYDQTTSKNNESISKYLSGLATLKNVILSCNQEGNLVYTQIDPNAKPIANFSSQDNSIISVQLQCNGQGMHSIIKVEGSAILEENTSTDKEKTGESGTISNPLIKTFRPTVLTQGTENNTIKDASKAALANELKNISLVIEMRGWKVVDEEIILPGSIISVTSPQVGIYQKANFLVRSVALKEDPKQRTSTLTCVLPETMTGETPKIVF